MCLGGGGDGGAGAARQQEELRQKNIRDSINKVNEIFGGPITRDVITPPAPTPAPATAAPRRLGADQSTGFAGWEGAGTANKGVGWEGAPTGGAPNTAVKFAVPSNAAPPATTTTNAPGQFGPEYYGGLEKSYLDYYKPQLDEQFRTARHGVTLEAARRGALDSSASGQGMGDLVQQMLLEQAGLSGRAKDYVNQQKQTLEDQRSQLVNLANTGVGQEQLANIASQHAAAYSQPAQFSPLADVFQKATALAANSRLAAGAGYRPLTFRLPIANTGGGGGGSAVTTVR